MRRRGLGTPYSTYEWVEGAPEVSVESGSLPIDTGEPAYRSGLPWELVNAADAATLPCDELITLVDEIEGDGKVAVVWLEEEGRAMTVHRFRNGCYGGADYVPPEYAPPEDELPLEVPVAAPRKAAGILIVGGILTAAALAVVTGVVKT